MIGRAALVAFLMLAYPPAGVMAVPTDYVVIPEQSTVAFRFTENGKKREGEFENFKGTGRFDQDAPGEAKLEFRVESRSIELGNELIDAFAQTREWFDSEAHPLVTFRLTSLEPLTAERYIAEGVLSIRGEARPVSAPVRLVFGDGVVHAEGDLRVDRKAYGLGMGASRAFVDIGAEVSVAFDLVARPVN